MKRILVYDIAAESGGALSILSDFYQYVTKFEKDTEWCFVVSKAELPKANNAIVIKCPEIKKSWIHRVIFDIFTAPKIVKKFSPDVVFSMQNIVLLGIKQRQVLYMHQSIPFSEIRFVFRESKKLWVIQNILSRLIVYSICKADHVVVQTNWIADSAAKMAKVDREKISVILPSLPSIDTSVEYKENMARHVFLYPVSAVGYKNHSLIVSAVQLLIQRGITDFKVIFTATYDELSAIGINDICDSIQCIGAQPRNKVLDMLHQSTLLFPSRLETLGIPLLEGKMCKTFILSADMLFAHDILGGYPNVDYFDVYDPEELADKMQAIILKERPYYTVLCCEGERIPIGWGRVVALLKAE